MSWFKFTHIQFLISLSQGCEFWSSDMHAAQALLSCGLCWWVLPIRGSLRTQESRFILKIFTDLTRLLTQECRKKKWIMMGCLDLALLGALLDFNGYSTLMFGCDPFKGSVLEEL